MKFSTLRNVIVFGLIVSVAAVGCKKKPGYLTPLPGARAGQPSDLASGQPLGSNINPSDTSTIPTTGIPQGPGHDGWTPNADMFKSDTVHFDFDSSVVKSGEKSKVAKVADYLKGNAGEALRVEGHCDERGTEEYNRALGERRALALREELVRLGIDPTRVDTISFGEDKPVDPGHDESAWRKNRRGEFILLSPPK